jgi:hypothetical protein
METRFYAKRWFILLMLVLFAPVGILLLWKFGKFSRTTNFVLTAVFSIWFIIILIPKGGSVPMAATNLSAVATTTYVGQQTPSPATTSSEPTVSPTASPMPNPTALAGFNKMDVNEKNIKAVLAPVFGPGELKSVEIKKNTTGSGYIVDVTFNLDDQALEAVDLARQSAIKAVTVLSALLSNTKVDKAWAWTEAGMVDDTGTTTLQNVINVSMTKKTAAGIDWATFSHQVADDYKVLYDNADSHFVYPAIANKLK